MTGDVFGIEWQAAPIGSSSVAGTTEGGRKTFSRRHTEKGSRELGLRAGEQPSCTLAVTAAFHSSGKPKGTSLGPRKTGRRRGREAH